MEQPQSSELKFFRLEKDEYIASFDCGDEDLNEFILNDAALYSKALIAVSYVVVYGETEQIAAYFSLANDKVSIADFKSKTEFNRFRKRRFVNEKRLKSYPAVKLCRLGVDLSFRDKHLGTQILNSIKSMFVLNNKTGCRFLTVDAYADAVPFYLKNGFIPLTLEDDGTPTRLLYFDLNDLVED